MNAYLVKCPGWQKYAWYDDASLVKFAIENMHKLGYRLVHKHEGADLTQEQRTEIELDSQVFGMKN